MTAIKVLIRNMGGTGDIESTVSSSQLTDGPFLATISTDSTLTGNGTVGSPLHAVPVSGLAQNVLTANTTVGASYSMITTEGFDTAGYALDTNGGILAVV